RQRAYRRRSGSTGRAFQGPTAASEQRSVDSAVDLAVDFAAGRAREASKEGKHTRLFETVQRTCALSRRERPHTVTLLLFNPRAAVGGDCVRKAASAPPLAPTTCEEPARPRARRPGWDALAVHLGQPKQDSVT